MTNQEIFNKVRDHLLGQMVKSQKIDGKEKACLYRGPNGYKCAIGALIPDEKYNPAMEGWAVSELPLEQLGFEESQWNLLMDLQEVHDSHDPYFWMEELKKVAKEHKLSFTGRTRRKKA